MGNKFSKYIKKGNRQKQIIIISFLFIPMIFLSLFSYYPLIRLVQFSFTDWDGASPHSNFIGMKNYITLFTDSSILPVLFHNAAYGLIIVIQNILALYFAIILNQRIIGRDFFKSVIFLPYIINGVAVAFIFNYLYDFDSSPINLLLRNIGLGNMAIHWLNANYSINFSLALICLWRYTGFSMVIFLGALQSIPGELYEAAEIDGINFFQSIRYITIPSIKRVIALQAFLGINGMMQVFFEPFIITSGGPMGKSETFVTKTLEVAFKFNDFGLASAMGVFLTVIIFGLIVIQSGVMKKGGELT